MKSHPRIATAMFSLPADIYVGKASAVWWGRNWWWMSLPVVACVIAGAWRVEMFLVALMVACLVFPAVRMIAYINLSASGMARSSLFLQYVCFDNGKLQRHFVADSRHSQLPTDQSLGFSDIKRTTVEGSYMIFYLNSSPYHLVIIPLSSMNKDDISAIHNVFAIYGMDFA